MDPGSRILVPGSRAPTYVVKPLEVAGRVAGRSASEKRVDIPKQCKREPIWGVKSERGSVINSGKVHISE